MTDIGPWRDLIHVARIYGGEGKAFGVPVRYMREYVMVPLDAYQMGNVIDAVEQAGETGDWYGEFCDIVAAAMQKMSLTKLSSNRGKGYTYEQIRTRLGSRPLGIMRFEDLPDSMKRPVPKT